MLAGISLVLGALRRAIAACVRSRGRSADRLNCGNKRVCRLLCDRNRHRDHRYLGSYFPPRAHIGVPVICGITKRAYSLSDRLDILLVEDDDLVMMSFSDMLRDMGHDVFEAPAAPEALAWLDKNRSLDVLITDIDLSGMDGRELVRQARRLVPALRVIYSSGHRAEKTPDLGSDPLARFLQKPFGPWRSTQCFEAHTPTRTIFREIRNFGCVRSTRRSWRSTSLSRRRGGYGSAGRAGLH